MSAVNLPIPKDTQVKKFLSLKVASIEDNVLKGDASAIGNMDRGADVIFPGFYSDALVGFLKSGFVALGHNWAALPVAMPTHAEEKGNVLYCEAKYHTHQAAQDARNCAMERKDAGLDVGLSVGFSMKGSGYKWFKNGTDLLSFAKENGYDLSLFDEEGIKAHTTPCRGLLKCDELYEYSIVTVPANPNATVSEAKSAEAKFYADWSYDYAIGAYRDTTAASATVGALNQLYYKLCDRTADVLADATLTAEEKTAALAPVFQRFSDQSVAIIQALMSILEDQDEEAKAAAVEAVRKGAPGLAPSPAADIVSHDTDTKTQSDSVREQAKAAAHRAMTILASFPGSAE